MQRKWMCSTLVRKYCGIFFDGEKEKRGRKWNKKIKIINFLIFIYIKIKNLKIYKLKISFIIYIFFHNKSNKRIWIIFHFFLPYFPFLSKYDLKEFCKYATFTY